MNDTEQIATTTNTMANEDIEQTLMQQVFSTIERLFAFLLTMAFLYFSSKLIGGSDIAFAFFWIVTWTFVAYRLFDIKSKLRRTSQIYFAPNTMVHRFLGTRSILLLGASVVFAAFVSMSFLVTTKVLTLQNGTLVTMISLGIPLFFFQLSGNFTFSIDKQVSSNDNQKIVAEVVDLGVKAVVMTLVFAIIFSMLDTVRFYINSADFRNFSDLARDKSIEWSSSGRLSRIPVNFMAIQSAFTSASISELIASIGASKDSFSPFWFWFLSIFFNILKLLPFCVTLIFIFTSLKNTQRKSFSFASTVMSALFRPLKFISSWEKPKKSNG